mmetsp:Transcript_3692/g.8776  ORF Transcript_3692/g.8776 Transcript_3692/m.8776 type:complete len:133 (-) Transcript_3692:143-541(-)|eukprot:CAMPEP_0114538168 /NCGR_PEP_ID=MMETSP0109-20121206/29988_1 /TAXON_ID=29199 /ORGANISM="Chlorarachnion reptans, Strain CCCM449" /LENGTH=132 /DNA_ID=CAMNT_0001722147 /DNA_START=131 /DNA_END=529 /DNA_ORIENTATION=+
MDAAPLECNSRVAESIVCGAKIGVLWGLAESAVYWKGDGLPSLRYVGSNIAQSGYAFSFYMAAFSGAACFSKNLRGKDDGINLLAGGAAAFSAAQVGEFTRMTPFLATARQASIMGLTGSFLFTIASGFHKK